MMRETALTTLLVEDRFEVAEDKLYMRCIDWSNKSKSDCVGFTEFTRNYSAAFRILSSSSAGGFWIEAIALLYLAALRLRPRPRKLLASLGDSAVDRKCVACSMPTTAATTIAKPPSSADGSLAY